MSSKRKRSRLTKTDVSAICEMQRNIYAYESYIIALAGFSRSPNTPNKYVVCKMGTDMDDWVLTAWNNIEKMKEELEKISNVLI